MHKNIIYICCCYCHFLYPWFGYPHCLAVVQKLDRMEHQFPLAGEERSWKWPGVHEDGQSPTPNDTA